MPMAMMLQRAQSATRSERCMNIALQQTNILNNNQKEQSRMKKQYDSPKMQLIVFNTKDVITISGGPELDDNEMPIL